MTPAAGDDLGTPFLRFERRGPLGYVIVDRPEARNALTSAMYLGVRLALDLVERDRDLHGLVITGTGDVFVPGGDMTGTHDDATHDAIPFIGIDVLPFQALRRSRVPVVASVNGLCQGGGLIIAMCADVTVASDRATFRAPETLRGVVDVNLAAMLPVHVGVPMARDMLMTGRRLSATEALQAGLIARVCPHAELESATLQAAKDLLMAAPQTRAAVKEIINRRYGTIDEITFAGSLSSAEVLEGFAAFAEKREPNWVPEAFREGRRL
ncbi:MAG: enoyl-CoA hydratase/isomerase family protein [Actinomycetota bacterium]